jgi:hypothetical protein
MDPASADEDHYFLYHQSIMDWIKDEKRAQEFWVDVATVHQRIVNYYHQEARSWDDIDWDQVDVYGLNYLSAHLYALDENPEYRTQMYDLISRPVMLAKRWRNGSDQAFARGVDLAMQTAALEILPNWPQVGQHCLIYATLGSLSTNVLPEMLGALAAAGQVERASGYAELVQETQQQFESFSQIARALAAQGELVSTVNAWKRALAVTQTIQEER